MYADIAPANCKWDAYKNVERGIKYLAKSSFGGMTQHVPEASLGYAMEWSEIVDVLSDTSGRVMEQDKAPLSSEVENCCETDMLQIDPDAKVYRIAGAPVGFYIISRALTVESQIRIAERTVFTYSQAEHTNLTNLAKIQNAEQSTDGKDKDSILSSGTSTAVRKCHSPTKCLEVPQDEQQRQQGIIPFSEFFKLRWACLGYHYDWTKRMYEKGIKTPFPVDLSAATKTLAAMVGETIEPEAAIVNFYPSSGTMGGHLDDAEHNMQRPIVSISLGCSAVFLIGGSTRDVKPVAVLVRSGDVVIMAEESRYCYHGIPAVLPMDVSISTSSPPKSTAGTVFSAPPSDPLYAAGLLAQQQKLAKNGGIDPERSFLLSILREGRININVRQVTVHGDGREEDWREKSGSGAAKKAKTVI